MTSSWMLVAGFLFAAMGVFVKLGSTHFGVAELAFYRSAFTLVIVVGLIGWSRGTVRSAHLGTHIVRGVDLLAFISRQIWLQRLLGCPTPS